MTKDWKLYAHHILDCISKVKDIHHRGDIGNDFVLYDAVLRNLQTLSEATRHLPETQKNLYPDVEWKNISGFRNILVHNYLGDIDPNTIIKVIDVYLSALEESVQKMLNNKV